MAVAAVASMVVAVVDSMVVADTGKASVRSLSERRSGCGFSTRSRYSF
jgi:hypothetical protein